MAQVMQLTEHIIFVVAGKLPLSVQVNSIEGRSLYAQEIFLSFVVEFMRRIYCIFEFVLAMRKSFRLLNIKNTHNLYGLTK